MESLYLSALENSCPQDAAILVLLEAHARLGISLQFQPLPGERALIEAIMDRTDGEVSRLRVIDSKHDNLVRISVVFSQLEGVVFTRGPALFVEGLSSREGCRVGGFTGSKFVEKNTVAILIQDKLRV